MNSPKTLESLPLNAAARVVRFLPNTQLRQVAKVSKTTAVAANAELRRRRRAYQRRGDKRVDELMRSIGPVAEAVLLGDRTRLKAFEKEDVTEESYAKIPDLVPSVRLPDGLGYRFSPASTRIRPISGDVMIMLAAYVNPEAAALLPASTRPDPMHLVEFVERNVLRHPVTYDPRIIDHYKRILDALSRSSRTSAKLWMELLRKTGPKLGDAMLRRGVLTVATLRKLLTSQYTISGGRPRPPEVMDWMLERVRRAYGWEVAARIAVKSIEVRGPDRERFLSRLPATMNYGAVSARRKEPLLHAFVRKVELSPEERPGTEAFLRRTMEASKNARNHKGRTALHAAPPTYHGALFRAGVDPMATDHRGRYFVNRNRSYSTSASASASA